MCGTACKRIAKAVKAVTNVFLERKKMNEKKACKQASCWYGVSRGRAGLLSMLGIVPGVAGPTVLNLHARILLLAEQSADMFKTESRLVATLFTDLPGL
jgi:hypothetical protein